MFLSFLAWLLVPIVGSFVIFPFVAFGVLLFMNRKMGFRQNWVASYREVLFSLRLRKTVY
jgi:hypothetical protein